MSRFQVSKRELYERADFHHVAVRIKAKLKHWRGFQTEKAHGSAPVLEFVFCAGLNRSAT